MLWFIFYLKNNSYCFKQYCFVQLIGVLYLLKLSLLKMQDSKYSNYINNLSLVTARLILLIVMKSNLAQNTVLSLVITALLVIK